MKASPLISVVTPTFRRPREVAELLANLNEQMLLPSELLLVDGSPRADRETEHVFKERTSSLRFPCHYIARAGGTAIQRNIGIDQARGDFLALIDDDIRLEPEFFALMVESFVEESQATLQINISTLKRPTAGAGTGGLNYLPPTSRVAMTSRPDIRLTAIYAPLMTTLYLSTSWARVVQYGGARCSRMDCASLNFFGTTAFWKTPIWRCARGRTGNCWSMVVRGVFTCNPAPRARTTG